MARVRRTVLDELCELLEGALASSRGEVRIDFTDAQAEALRLQTRFEGELNEPLSLVRIRELLSAVEARREHSRKLQLLSLERVV